MTSDKLTVCIPVYNGAKYLADSIASVLDQSYTDFRLIICDDCSTDNSPEVIKSFRDHRVCYVRNPERLGLVGNFNKCISLSTGEYICLWHQDDVMLPENLRKKVEMLDAHPTVGFVHSNNIMVDEFTHQERGTWGEDEDTAKDYIVPGRYLFFMLFRKDIHIACPSVMMRAECYSRLGGYRKELPYACDWEMYLRVALYYDVAYIGEQLIRKRWHSAQETHSFLKSGEDVMQKELAERMVLAEHGNRILDNALTIKIVVHRTASLAISRAVRALSTPPTSSQDFRKAWRLFRLAISRRPAVLASREARWVLKRLLLGPVGLRFMRSAKHRLARTSRRNEPPLEELPKQVDR